ncbi:hypothetical protein JMN32_20720 [Fulvivirga sp. 29W222]|uniref:Uncharacterized protein n=1 Tax=Fulvivirga marina TaxID=2494733 RepID=A0A937G2B8_9BACT|nr:hypothetical protein [Fulvivirga marina]MBL6448748.1 hypothetical protein [Fulvivirga marina]
MNNKNNKLPYKISAYINDHFKEDFLFDVKRIRKGEQGVIYTVEVSKDGYIHELNFNEEGKVLSQDTEQAFPMDDHDGNERGEVPE